jgi:predicted metal-dependent hydrolase
MTTHTLERSKVRFGNTTIGYSIRRSARRGTVSIAVDQTEGVLVTAPAIAPIDLLDGIVHAKAAWIARRMKHQSDLPPAPSAREFVSGETFLYLGRQYRLRVQPGDGHGPVRLDNGWLCVPVPRYLRREHRAAVVRTALISWYERQARKRLAERAGTWAERLGLAVSRVVVSEPRKRWGSASPSGTIRLNWRIVQAPASLVDYVVVHELMHLRHRNHTGAFWTALGRVMPDYDTRKVKLRSLGPEMAW